MHKMLPPLIVNNAAGLLQRLGVQLLVVVTWLASGTAADAAHLMCPFCEAPDVTLTQQVQQSDVAVFVQWVEGKPLDREANFPGYTT